MPNLYSRLLQSLILPLGDLLFHGNYSKKLKSVRQVLQASEKEILEFQEKSLEHILEHALKASPHYANLGIDKGNHSASNLLKQFPLLSKEELKHRENKILTMPFDSLVRNATSGSSGLQTRVYVSKEEQSTYRAIQTVWWEWAGFVIGQPMLQTGLAKTRTFEKRLKDFFFRTWYLYAFGLNRENTQEAIEWTKKTKAFVGGYASSLFVLSDLIDEPIQAKAAISWGDKLFDHYKDKISEKLSCEIYETYGTGEGLMIAAQHDLNYMYLMSPYVYLELLDDDGNPVEDGEIGHVVVTSLIHKAMPLIRYRLGDLAIRLPKSAYPEKRRFALPLLQKVIGRETDIVKTPRGKKLIVHSFTGILEYYDEIKQFCVLQSRIEGIRIQYIPDRGFDPSILDKIRAELLKLIDEEFEIEFEKVEEITATASGKPQIVISKLPRARLEI
jgi:phenylacetate-CoA ligase